MFKKGRAQKTRKNILKTNIDKRPLDDMSGSTALKRPPHIPHWVQIRSFLSGRDPIGNVRRSLTCPRPPRPPLGPHLALPNRVLVEGPCKALIPYALTGSPVGAILLCDMRPSAARALLPAGPCGLFRRVPSASPRRANFFSKPQMLFSFLVVYYI